MKPIYYSIENMLNKTRPDFALVIGQRGNGKTFSALKLVLKEYKKTRRRFVYIRRWKEDIINGRAETLFNPLSREIEKMFGEDYAVIYYRRRFYLCNEKGDKLDCIGYCVSLSEASHTKSQSFGTGETSVKYLIFDEFIQMSGETTLRDEMSKFENTLSSIIRTLDDCVVIMLANTVSKFSPYFVHFGIDINKVEQGDIITKEYPLDDNKGVLRIALEYCAYNPEIGKKTSKYTQSKMISSGKWEIPQTDDIPSVVGEIVKDRLLCTIYDPDADVIIGIFVRSSKWVSIEKNKESLIYYNKTHVREFLILRLIDHESSYFHLTDQKSLTYTRFNDISLFLRAIYDQTEIDIENELYMGRIFADNMFTADYFNHVWSLYGQMTPRKLL